MDSMSELVSRVINGDKQAFEAIYQATYRQVYYTCMSFLKNEQNAQDIMQDTYIGEGTYINCVVSDKNAFVRDGRLLSGTEEQPYFISKGQTL